GLRHLLATCNTYEALFRVVAHPSLELSAIAHRERHLYQRAAVRLSCVSLKMQRNCTSQLLPSLILVSLRRRRPRNIGQPVDRTAHCASRKATVQQRRRRQRSLRILRSTATAVVGVRSDYAARKVHRAPTEV